MTAIVLEPIGWVRSPLTDPADAPRQGFLGAPEASIELEPHVLDGLAGLRAGDEVVVLTWLHRARRDVLRARPRGDDSGAPRGVFDTRSPHRPNPIGVHVVQIDAIDGATLRVRDLEAVDGTPVVDIKAALHPRRG